MIPIVVNSHSYRSISEAWRAESPEGLKEITVRLRLRLGWTPDDAFLIPKVPAVDRRTFATNRTKIDEVSE